MPWEKPFRRSANSLKQNAADGRSSNGHFPKPIKPSSISSSIVLSTVRHNYAASCPGAGDPNFAINLTLV